MPDDDPGFERAQQDRLSTTGGLVSLAYWILRAVTGPFALVSRALRLRRDRG